MRKLQLRLGTYMVAMAFLVACGSTPPPKPTIEVPDPKPLTVSATQDETRSVSALIPVGGGALEVIGADGAVFRLTIPGRALLSPTTITMTPLVDLSGSPVTGSMYGVALEPAGLRLYDAATLEIVPASDGAVSAIGFAANSNGSQFHLAPPARSNNADSVTLNLFHFSLHGAFSGTKVEPYTIEGSPNDFMPSDWEAQQEQLLSDLLAKERTAELLGQEGDPELARKLEAILNTTFQRAISPLLSGIAGNCASMKANGSKVLGWVRTVELVGLGTSFASEVNRVEAATRSGANRCWEEAIQPCIDPAAASYGLVLEATRLNLLLGGSSAVYDPAREDLRCDNECAWVADVIAVDLDFSFNYQLEGPVLGGAARGKLSRQWTAQARLPLDLDNPSSHLGALFRATTEAGNPMDVSYSVEASVTSDRNGTLRSVIGSGTVPPGLVTLVVDISTLSCVIGGVFELDGVPVEVYQAQYGTETRDLAIGWAKLFRQQLTPGVVHGVVVAPGDGSDYHATINLGLDPVLADFRNADILGAAQIEWTVTMITKP